MIRTYFQRETERSFARLRDDWFAGAGSQVAGQCGRKPERIDRISAHGPRVRAASAREPTVTT